MAWLLCCKYFYSSRSDDINDEDKENNDWP